jgi:hypothetical protein
LLDCIELDLNIKLALALIPTCANCGASIFSPGKEAQNSETGGQNAKAFAPGQAELIYVFRKLKDRNCKVLLSNSDTAYVKELYSDLHKTTGDYTGN